MFDVFYLLGQLMANSFGYQRLSLIGLCYLPQKLFNMMVISIFDLSSMFYAPLWLIGIDLLLCVCLIGVFKTAWGATSDFKHPIKGSVRLLA